MVHSRLLRARAGINNGLLLAVGASTLLAGGFSPASAAEPVRAPRKPNLVFVLSDDQGYGDLHCHGNPIVQTPALDAFHDQSLRFRQFHVGSTCAPSRAGLLTGMNCNSVGVWHTIGGAAVLRDGVATLPQILADHGYATGLFGKWHLGDDYPYRPQDRGFGETVYHRGGGLGQISDHWGNKYFDDTYLVNGVATPFKGYCTDVFFGEALKFIERHRDEPFCCFITPNAPHSPYNVQARYRDLYASAAIPEERKRFYGMITNLDENFARLMTQLHTLGLERDTILVFMTDNGTACGAKTDPDDFVVSGFNAGMRGTKGSPFDGGHHVPFFLRYPAGGLDSGRDIPNLSSYIDFLPTVLDLCGVAGPKVEGMSLRPLLEGKAAPLPDRALVVDTQRTPYPIKWRLSSVMRGDWRMINGRELYNLAADPEERQNIAAAHPELVEALRQEYERWWTDCSRQFDVISAVHIGSEKCRQVDMTTQELRNENGDVVYSQAQVRAGKSSLGWWDIFAERDGTYQVTLRRWPEETHYKIAQSISGFDIDRGPAGLIEEPSMDTYRGGKAIDVYGAALKIDGQQLYKDIEAGADQVTFEVPLKRGPHVLRAWFSGGNNYHHATLQSPYYVTIKN